MTKYDFLRKCLKESRVADAIYLIFHEAGKSNAEYYLWDKIGGTMLVFRISLEDNCIFKTKWIDDCKASNPIVLERYAQFIRLVENNEKKI